MPFHALVHPTATGDEPVCVCDGLHGLNPRCEAEVRSHTEIMTVMQGDAKDRKYLCAHCQVQMYPKSTGKYPGTRPQRNALGEIIAGTSETYTITRPAHFAHPKNTSCAGHHEGVARRAHGELRDVNDPVEAFLVSLYGAIATRNAFVAHNGVHVYREPLRGWTAEFVQQLAERIAAAPVEQRFVVIFHRMTPMRSAAAQDGVEYLSNQDVRIILREVTAGERRSVLAGYGKNHVLYLTNDIVTRPNVAVLLETATGLAGILKYTGGAKFSTVHLPSIFGENGMEAALTARAAHIPPDALRDDAHLEARVDVEAMTYEDAVAMFADLRERIDPIVADRMQARRPFVYTTDDAWRRDVWLCVICETLRDAAEKRADIERWRAEFPHLDLPVITGVDPLAVVVAHDAASAAVAAHREVVQMRDRITATLRDARLSAPLVLRQLSRTYAWNPVPVALIDLTGAQLTIMAQEVVQRAAAQQEVADAQARLAMLRHRCPGLHIPDPSLLLTPVAFLREWEPRVHQYEMAFNYISGLQNVHFALPIPADWHTKPFETMMQMRTAVAQRVQSPAVRSGRHNIETFIVIRDKMVEEWGHEGENVVDWARTSVKHAWSALYAMRDVAHLLKCNPGLRLRGTGNINKPLATITLDDVTAKANYFVTDPLTFKKRWITGEMAACIASQNDNDDDDSGAPLFKRHRIHK
jgi:hypothetical protein